MKNFTRCFVFALCMMIGFTAEAAFRLGDQGSEVAEIQGRLSELGFDVSADGEFGPATLAAVKEFQKANGLAVDGIVGDGTFRALLGRAPAVSRSSNLIAKRLIGSGMQHIGTPYVFGGSYPGGFDCSGFVRYVFATAGFYLPRTADAQYEVGMPVSGSEMAAGDLVFFSTYEYGPSHVGIYLGGNNFLHASSSQGVTVSSLHNSYWAGTYIGARRVF